jgi:hypothetical protein
MTAAHVRPGRSNAASRLQFLAGAECSGAVMCGCVRVAALLLGLFYFLVCGEQGATRTCYIRVSNGGYGRTRDA